MLNATIRTVIFQLSQKFHPVQLKAKFLDYRYSREKIELSDVASRNIFYIPKIIPSDVYEEATETDMSEVLTLFDA